MFTGLIEAVCTVKSVRQALTVAALQSRLATFDISPETLAKSTLGKLRPESSVNIERALKLSDRLGGHFVLGHIDGTATIKTIHKHGQFADIEFATSPDLLDQMVVKGSVAVDGISLTIANMSENSFTTTIIPETLKKTTLGRAKSGDHVNIETDIIAKIIRKHLQKILPDGQKLTIEKLRALGF
ncbi:MAG: riboflavin synthase [Planctomycetota bacterium]|jgi:riboflavin synthase